MSPKRLAYRTAVVGLIASGLLAWIAPSSGWAACTAEDMIRMRRDGAAVEQIKQRCDAQGPAAGQTPPAGQVPGRQPAGPERTGARPAAPQPPPAPALPPPLTEDPVSTPSPLPPPVRQAKPPSPPVSVTHYWVEQGGTGAGPLTLEQVVARIQSGQTKRTDKVWRPPLADWVQAESLDELKPIFPQAQPPELGPRVALERFLLGVWEATEPDQGAGIVSQTIIRYEANGSFSGTVVGRMAALPAVPPTTIPLQGRWEITPMSDRQFALTLSFEGGVGYGGGGMRQQSWAFQIVDENTLLNTLEGSRAHRVRQ